MTKFEVGKTYKTRDGREARVICIDRKVPSDATPAQIVALVTMKNGFEGVHTYRSDGSKGWEHTPGDLLLPAPKVWVVAAVEDGECKDAFHVYRENYVDEFRELLTRQFPSVTIITKEVDLTEDSK